jgi:hypothetical protein
MSQTEEEKFLKRPKNEAEYFKTHLMGMDAPKKRWYLNTMKNWTKEHYDNYTKFYLWMIGNSHTME